LLQFVYSTEKQIDFHLKKITQAVNKPALERDTIKKAKHTTYTI